MVKFVKILFGLLAVYFIVALVGGGGATAALGAGVSLWLMTAL